MYEAIYQFVAKNLIQSNYLQNPAALNWKGLSKFEVGRSGNKNIPVKRSLVLVAVVLYLLFGFLLWIGIKLFSS